MAVTVHPSFAIHAGEWLRTEIVEAHGVSMNRLAEALGVSRQAISALLHGRSALSAEMAIRFEHAFGVKAETLMRMQARYELARAREREGELSVKRLVAA
jgi:addiction module HigA family antidote